jgi:hypothetical protein
LLWRFVVGKDQPNCADNLTISSRPNHDMTRADVKFVSLDIRAWLGGLKPTLKTINLMTQAVGLLQDIRIASYFDRELLAHGVENG